MDIVACRFDGQQYLASGRRSFVAEFACNPNDDKQYRHCCKQRGAQCEAQLPEAERQRMADKRHEFFKFAVEFGNCLLLNFLLRLQLADFLLVGKAPVDDHGEPARQDSPDDKAQYGRQRHCENSVNGAKYGRGKVKQAHWQFQPAQCAKAG